MTKKLLKTYDSTLKIGQLITAYHSGFHILTEIHFRDPEEPLFYYTKVLNENGTKSEREVNSSSALWCGGVTAKSSKALMKQQIKQAKEQYNNTMEYLNDN